jgi:hypothetical protein
MPSRKLRVLIAVASLPLWLPLASCGPKKPAVDTPAFYWDAARETFAARDYLKTTEHLRRIIRTDNEFTQRALPWRLAVSSGLAQVYLDLASDCQKGVSANPQTPGPVRQAMSNYRLMAETRVLEFAETFIQFRKVYKEPTVTLDFAFPTVNVADILERGKVQAGTLPSAEMMASVERRMMERAIADAVAASVGAPGDIAKGRAAFQGGRAQVSREVFMAAMLKSLYNQTELFSREAMNKLDRLMLFVEQGMEALKTMEASEQNKQLANDFQMLLKSAKQPRP